MALGAGSGVLSEQDFIRGLGRPFLAHRLKRASEAILEATAGLLANSGYRGPPRSVSTVLLLEQRGPLSITEISAALKLSHPHVITLVRALTAVDYVAAERSPSDSRKRVISLTDAGRRQAGQLQVALARIDRAFASLFGDMDVDLLADIERFEAAIEAKSLAERLKP